MHKNDANVPREAWRCTLLYVEDGLVNMRLVEKIIACNSDMRLQTAANGNSGIETARASRPEVIVMDINLPDISGPVQSFGNGPQEKRCASHDKFI